MKLRVILFSALLASAASLFAADAKPETKPADPKNKKSAELELCCDPADADASAKPEPKKDSAKQAPPPDQKK
jgi:hypothetical protein